MGWEAGWARRSRGVPQVSLGASVAWTSADPAPPAGWTCFLFFTLRPRKVTRLFEGRSQLDSHEIEVAGSRCSREPKGKVHGPGLRRERSLFPVVQTLGSGQLPAAAGLASSSGRCRWGERGGGQPFAPLDCHRPPSLPRCAGACPAARGVCDLPGRSRGSSGLCFT